MSRYLTNAQKEKEIVHLETLYAKATPNINDGLDSPMVPYLKKLNQILGLVTLQSCCGHRTKERDEDIKSYQNGHLWIKLSKDMANAFYHKIHNLDMKDIEAVGILFKDFDEGLEEIVEIYFVGLGRKKSIHKVMNKIIAFFNSLI